MKNLIIIFCCAFSFACQMPLPQKQTSVNTTLPATSIPSQPPSNSSPVPSTTSNNVDDPVLIKIKENARKDYPEDYSTQKYVYDKQVEAYKYMKTIPASSLKAKIERDQPLDFSTQKYVYNMELEAKEYMDSVPQSSLKSRIMKDYPDDFSTQKYVYNREMTAKEAMEDK